MKMTSFMHFLFQEKVHVYNKQFMKMKKWLKIHMGKTEYKCNFIRFGEKKPV